VSENDDDDRANLTFDLVISTAADGQREIATVVNKTCVNEQSCQGSNATLAVKTCTAYVGWYQYIVERRMFKNVVVKARGVEPSARVNI